jgi:uncharacterized protein involved in exopolysaccharide biosynthesis
MSFHEIIHTILFNIITITKITVLSAITIFIYLLLISPITYHAPVTVLPPAEQDQMSGLGSLLSGGAGDFSNLLFGGGLQGNSQLYLEILKSRTAAEYVVRKNNLIEYFGSDDLYDATEELRKNLELDLSKEGIITISIGISTVWVPRIFSEIDSVKSFSAQLSNSYVEALDMINREKISFKAKRAREYIEEQLQINEALLDSAEFELMEFQKENKTISLPEQLKAAIESSAQIKSEIIQTDIEIGLLEPNLREDNQTLIALRKKLIELQEEYDKFEIGAEDYLVAFDEVPELGMELAKRLREVKIQNEVYLLLQQQYYKEKIQENRDLPTIEILDEAIPPHKASSPRLFYSTILGAIFIFLFVSCYFIVKEKKLISLKNKMT